MAVTQIADSNSKPPVEEGIEPLCREEADARPCGLTQTSGNHVCAPDRGLSSRRQDTNKDNSRIVKPLKPKRSRTKDNESDSLSDIDDAEVMGYLNNKREMQYKQALWEAFNRQYTISVMPKKKKRTTETKKVVPIKLTVKTAVKVDLQKRSSKINYDALKALNDDLNLGSEMAELTKPNSYTERVDDSPNGNIHEFYGSNYNEDQQDTSYSEDNGTSGHYTDDMHYEDKEYEGYENFDEIF